MWAAVPGLPEVIFKAFLAIEKLQMKHVPYRDMSVALQDLAAERIHVYRFDQEVLVALTRVALHDAAQRRIGLQRRAVDRHTVKPALDYVSALENTLVDA